MHKFLAFSCFAMIVCIVFVGSPNSALAAWDSKQKAVIVYGHTPQDYGQQAFFDVVDEAKSVGADTISLTIDWYQKTASDAVFYRGKATPRDDMLVAGIRYIRSQGLDVYLLIRPETSEWRAEIDPSDRNAWFNNYGAILNKYATMGQNEGVKGLSLGTEMYKVTSVVYNSANEAGWRAMIADVKKRFDGELTYSAQHSGDKSDLFEIKFWNQLDYIGVSAYFYLSDNLDGDLRNSLVESWAQIDQGYIKKAYDLYGKPVVFTELGYRNIAQSYRDPWNANVERTYSEQTQSVAYDALLAYWSDKSYFGGWHIWSYEATGSRLPSGNTKFSPQGKKAEQTLANFWGGRVPVRTGVVTDNGNYIQCVDTPPLNDNKGWDETVGGCHVNGEPWIAGISDQPGYMIGDTVGLGSDNSDDNDGAPVVPPSIPQVPTTPTTPSIGTCSDTPPYGDNKGWNDKATGQKNCHVNGEPWIAGISDQPGYMAGDTIGLGGLGSGNTDDAEEVVLPEKPPVIDETEDEDDLPGELEFDAQGYPICGDDSRDTNGNGWGWDSVKGIGCVMAHENTDRDDNDTDSDDEAEGANDDASDDASDQTESPTPEPGGTPVCPSGTDDHDQNGWGWDPRLGGGAGAGCIMRS